MTPRKPDTAVAAESSPSEHGSKRIKAFDTFRGLLLISMMCFHAAYDAAYLYDIPLPWFTCGPFQDIWRSSISWSFLLLAGWMTIHSRSNIKRAAQYAVASIAIYIVTSVASVDSPISFGIIFCMAASTLAYIALKPAICSRDPLPVGFLALGLFLLLKHIPDTIYSISGLEWLGFPSERFYSGDYYPIIPYTFLYIAGASFARAWSNAHAQGDLYPAGMYRWHLPIVTWLGSHSLAVYLVHQPLLLLLFTLATYPAV
ncbi:heparan-alpha-glucosaminide N-acetyltransferase [Collinsella sp. D33t1_170424_A12]|uniref:heparan-alpha-glucosaminide N-acetyltransferase n=1 Tax=Collinsella sp. D33t1_170424_A12 TaxID=2787135 RepID=UPI001E349C1E|nr:heparan-alpha-glucosaminide N-acetyltransferase [Collinsella sp. D33t1_170424_A12]